MITLFVIFELIFLYLLAQYFTFIGIKKKQNVTKRYTLYNYDDDRSGRGFGLFLCGIINAIILIALILIYLP